MATNDLRLTNSRTVPLTIFLEPWAEEIVLGVGDSLLISQATVHDGRLECDIVDAGYVLHGDVHAKLRIYRGSDVVWESYDA